MQLSLALAAVLVALLSRPALAATVEAGNPEHERARDVDIFAWPLSDSKPQTLAQISYTSANASVKSFNLPALPPSSSGPDAEEEIVRVGFYHPSGSWSGVATAASNFAADKPKKLQLYLRPNGDLYHLAFATADLASQGQGQSPGRRTSSGSGSVGSKDGLSVEVVHIHAGPVPHLNKRVVVSPDGSVNDKEPEKTFLQKYWWAIAVFLVVQLLVGGGGGGAGGGEKE